MSKAYQCNNCFECFPGDPAYRSDDGLLEYCPSCVRVASIFRDIDPMKYYNTVDKKEKVITEKEYPLVEAFKRFLDKD